MPSSPISFRSAGSSSEAGRKKLLANSDRWADRQVFSRDLIDLAILRSKHGPIPEPSWSKVDTAYKSAPRADLRKALSALDDTVYLSRCLEGLQVEDETSIREGLALLRQDARHL